MSYQKNPRIVAYKLREDYLGSKDFSRAETSRSVENARKFQKPEVIDEKLYS